MEYRACIPALCKYYVRRGLFRCLRCQRKFYHGGECNNYHSTDFNNDTDADINTDSGGHFYSYPDTHASQHGCSCDKCNANGSGHSYPHTRAKLDKRDNSPGDCYACFDAVSDSCARF